MPPVADIANNSRRLPQVITAVVAVVAISLPMLALPTPLSLIAPVVMALVPIGILFAFRNPFILCLMFVVVSFFRIHEVFPMLNPLRIPILVAIPTLAVLAWQIFVTKEIKPYWSVELKRFALFFVLTTLGVLAAVNRPTALAYWTATYWKIGIMVLAIAWLVRIPQDFALTARALVLGGIAVSIVAISNKFAGIGLVEGTRVTIGRDIGSVLGDPNDLSLVLLFPLAFAACLVAYPMGWFNKLIGAAGASLITWAIICTQSRGGLLGILATFGVIGFRVVKSKVLLISVGAIVGLALFLAMGINKRASGGAHEEGIDESAMGRIYAWGAAWKMATTRPLTGVGIDNFTANYFFYSDHWDGHNHAVHSTWFNVLAETGFPGFFAFVAMIFSSVASSIRSMLALDRVRGPPAVRAMALTLVAGFVGFCVGGTFLTQGFTWPIYILVALTAATGRFTRDELQRDQSALACEAQLLSAAQPTRGWWR